MATTVPYPEYDDLFLLYNQLRRRLDSSLKPLGLTVTALQTLVLIAQGTERRAVVTRANIAEALGLTDSTLSTAIKGLTARGLIQEKLAEDAWSKKQPLRLQPAGRRAMYRGLVARDVALEEFDRHLPGNRRVAFFAATQKTNESIRADRAKKRDDTYMKSLSKHSSRRHARSAA